MIEPDPRFAPIRAACRQLAGNIARLKQDKADVDKESSWSDAGLNRAWRKLERAIKGSLLEGTMWWGIWIQCAIDDAWRGCDESPGAIAQFLKVKVRNVLPQMESEWVAFTPLGRQFSDFPEYTDFRDFAIINATQGDPRSSAARFRAILYRPG
jgi:hypothetical protein